MRSKNRFVFTRPHQPSNTMATSVRFRSSSLFLFIALALLAHRGHGQWFGSPLSTASSVNNITGASMMVHEYVQTPSPCAQGSARFAVLDPSTPFGSTDYGGPSAYISVTPAGQLLQQFFVNISFEDQTGLPINSLQYGPSVQVLLDGAPCSSCLQNDYGVSLSDFGTDHFAVALGYPGGNSYDTPDGAHEYTIRYFRGNTAYCDFRFKVVVLGTVYSQVLGYYDSPALPLYILRDPPGDASYASLTQANGACFGQTTSATTGSTENGYFKARIGVSGTIGLIVTTNYEIYGEVGLDLTAQRSQTASEEYLTCLETTSEFTTPMTGPPDDVFIGSSVRYAYGVAKIVSRPTCDSIARDVRLAMTPVQVLSSYNYTESFIRGTVMPQLQQLIGTLDPTTEPYKNAVDQLSVWQQLLDMNDDIKTGAGLEVNRSFNGGGNGQSYSITQSTSQTRTIEYSASLDQGLGFEVGVLIGGSGITAGGRMSFQNSYGSSQSASNSSTNTMTYHLEDDDAGDDFHVQVRRDPVFGTYVFVLDSAASATSCEHEGGYQIDQPSLSVGAQGQNHMVLNEVPVGTGASFPLYVCNNSNVARTYFLKFRTNSNTEGGILNAFGNILNSNDNGLEIDLAAGECLNAANLVLTQPSSPIGPDYTIELYLYSLCEPAISSSITIEAHFGTGNFGGYCEPSSANGPSTGSFIDGVQLSAIDNTATGGTAGPTYNDYSAQYGTALSRNAQRIITITPGPADGTRYAAWIDYDRDGTFEAQEKLGEFVSSLPALAQSIPFTVPSNALVGSTIMRVRGVGPVNTEPTPIDPCYSYMNGETEDYAIVINANLPQDCAGVNNGTAWPGTACNDGNPNTGNDIWNANCQCIGVPLDCVGVPNGSTLPGTPCDDGDANTAGDVYDASCQCTGLPYDCAGIPGGNALAGSPCDDNDPFTGNDVYDGACQCAGLPLDCLGVPGGTTLAGTACDDGSAGTTGDVYNADCICAGTLVVDCLGEPGGPAQPGVLCNDGDPNTGNDLYTLDCICAGLPIDCAGLPGGTSLPGSPCDDLNPLSVEDVYNAECQCAGILPNDCAGVPGGPAQPGTPCDDGNADTAIDVYNAFCTCVGLFIDCQGTPGGLALPGTACDDGNADTINDAYDLGCVCAGDINTAIGTPGQAPISFTVQPNPSNGGFALVNPTRSSAQVTMMDATGREVLGMRLVTAHTTWMDVSGLGAGVYYLHASANGVRQVIKVMVEH